MIDILPKEQLKAWLLSTIEKEQEIIVDEKPANIVGSHKKATNEDVKKLLAQGYTSRKEVAEILGIGVSTLSKMDAWKYRTKKK